MLVAGALAVLAVLASLVATRDGIGVSRDSAVYLGTAESVARSDGYTVPFRPYPLNTDAGPLATDQRLVNFPPLYPGVVGTLSRVTGADTRSVARAVNAALLAALTLLVFGILLVASGRRIALALIVAVLTVVSADVLTAASMAWTELLFTVLAVLALLCVALHLETPRWWTLWGGGALIALACLTRLAGVALVLAAVISLLLLSRRPWRARIREAGVVALVGALPVLLWIGATAAGSDRLANRPVVLHAIGGDALARAWETTVSWVLPGQRIAGGEGGPAGTVVDAVARSPALVRGMVVLSLVAALVLTARRSRGRRAPAPAAGGLAFLPRVLVVFIGTYAGFLVVTISLFDASLARLDHRILLPAHVAVLLAAGQVVQQRVDFGRFRRPAVAVAVPVTLLLVASALVAVADGERLAGVYAADRWRRSPIMAAIAQMPSGRVVVTNEPNAVWAVTGRSTASVPEQKSVVTLRPNRELHADLVALGRAMRRDGAVLAYVDGAGESEFAASEATLLDTLPLRPVRREADGRIYEIDCSAIQAGGGQIC
jgi:4-amino-4-deoxy-L-arabinose transferase-like glycosyltransferase